MRFFFFQAEDGIRDVAVTGVQTCALPISAEVAAALLRMSHRPAATGGSAPATAAAPGRTKIFVNVGKDRKSTRLNSSHGYISYAVFCLKKKKKTSNYSYSTA